MSLPSDWFDKAKAIVGETNVQTATGDLERFSHDEYAMESFARMPEAAVIPNSEDKVAAIIKLCAETGVPVTARGGGTGLSAACVPSPGGVVLSLERLNKVVDADKRNYTITVQAGMTLHQLYEEVEKLGLYFPPHPGDEGAFVGGAVATNAGGARAVKYGTVKRFVLGLQVVMPDGSIVEFGGKLIKSSTGFNLLDLFVSSEGCLGIITRVTLSLLPPPGYVQTLVVPFGTVSEAIGAAPAILEAGIIPTAVEFIEHQVLRCAERMLERSWPARGGTASLMIILDGRTEDEVMTVTEQLAEIMEGCGALDVLLAESTARQAEILEMRSIVYEALRPGTIELFDICVPRSAIAGHVEFVRELAERLSIPLPTYGHAADGNVHTHSMRTTLSDGVIGEERPNWREQHETVRAEIFHDAVERGGVISGEHGIGLAKRDFLVETLGKANVELMRAVKTALDPKGIMNPGKVI